MNSYRFFLRALFFIILTGTAGTLYATHLRAGEITLTRVSCSSMEFIVTITVYTNTGSPIRFGQGTLDFGDGTSLITPTTENTTRPDLGTNIGTVSFSVHHVFPGAGVDTISYYEANRNAGILNIFNSVETPFFIQTVINIDPFLGCDNTPRLLVPPIDKACTGAAWYHNPGAYDPDGDSLSFDMTIPKRSVGQYVSAYRAPNANEFYVGLD